MKFVRAALLLVLPIAQAQRDGNELMALASNLNMLNGRIRPAVDAAYNGTGNSTSAHLSTHRNLCVASCPLLLACCAITERDVPGSLLNETSPDRHPPP